MIRMKVVDFSPNIQEITEVDVRKVRLNYSLEHRSSVIIAKDIATNEGYL